MSISTRPPRVTDANSRIRTKRRRTRLRRLRAIAIGVALLAVVAGGGWLVGFSSILAVTDVSVTGTKMLTVDAVKSSAQVPTGSPLATTDPEPIAKRVGAIPEVKSVTVTRSWPDAITIDVTERTTVFVVQSTVEGESWLVDEDGVIFHTVTSAPKGKLVAETESIDVNTLAGVATVVAALPEGLRKRVRSVSVVSVDDITLHLTGNARVLWGDASESALKGQVAEALLKVKARVYDVSSPTAPVTR